MGRMIYIYDYKGIDYIGNNNNVIEYVKIVIEIVFKKPILCTIKGNADKNITPLSLPFPQIQH